MIHFELRTTKAPKFPRLGPSLIQFGVDIREGVKKKLGKSGQADRFYFVKILTHFVLYKMAK